MKISVMGKILVCFCAVFVFTTAFATAALAIPPALGYEYLCDEYGQLIPAPVVYYNETRTTHIPVSYEVTRVHRPYAQDTVLVPTVPAPMYGVAPELSPMYTAPVQAYPAPMPVPAPTPAPAYGYNYNAPAQPPAYQAPAYQAPAPAPAPSYNAYNYNYNAPAQAPAYQAPAPAPAPSYNPYNYNYNAAPAQAPVYGAPAAAPYYYHGAYMYVDPHPAAYDIGGGGDGGR